MFDILSEPATWASLATLTAMEVVLGIDNIIFIAILCGALPPEQREKARKLGLLGAFVTRLMLLSVISYIVKLTTPLFTVAGLGFSGKALILLAGGLFLVYKATKEIHEKLEGSDGHGASGPRKTKFSTVIVQIMLLDLVFSIDSVITSVGMTEHLSIMVAANVVALAVMIFAGKYVALFVERHPSVKVLALSFLIMIGTMLIAEGFSFHVPHGYIYFAMGFSMFVEFLNIRARTKADASAPLKLKATPHFAEGE